MLPEPKSGSENKHPMYTWFTWLVPEQQEDEEQKALSERMVQRNPQQVSAISAGHGWSHGHMALIHNLHRYCRMGTGYGGKEWYRKYLR